VDPFPERYFEFDRLLDSPCLPAPGCFGSLEMEIAAAHVKNRLRNVVSLGGAAPDTVHLPSAELDWTVAPRFDLGYRLPAGFGELVLSYRFLSTDGSEDVTTADGPANLRSRLDLNMIDFDYASREFSLWPDWNMKWRFGGRLTYLFFDSHETEAFAEALAGSGIFDRGVSNSYVGFGPHSGLELARRLNDWGFLLVGRIDGAILLGRIRQGFFETSAVGAAGETRISSSQAVPMLNTQAGIGWQAPACPDLQLFLGYEYEYWWNVGRLSISSSRGEMSNQGICLRAEFHF
jgi:hypothetical protein